MARVFLVSPASCRGKRAEILSSPRATFDLAVRLRSEGATIAEVFRFLSGLYFRGKLAYAHVFAAPEEILIITPDRGLVAPETRIGVADLRSFAEVDVDPRDVRYLDPLIHDVRALHRRIGPAASVVLLGSIATGKYVDPLLEVFAERLLFPPDFIGRGDMSRGGLLLRCAEARRELPYISVAGATRHGARPPRLDPRRWPEDP